MNINQGKITNRKKVAEEFSALTDGYYLCDLKLKKTRSLNQNRFWWGIMVPAVKDGLRDIGYREVKTDNDAHEVIKGLFLKKQIGTPGEQKIIEITGSTADLTTVEFNELIDQVIHWSVEFLGVQIFLPNEQTIFTF